MDNNDVRPNVYYIPHNFVETGTLFNGMVKIRNFFEGLFLGAIPAPIIMMIPNISFVNRIAAFVACCGALALIGFIGRDGESLTQYMYHYLVYRKHRATARYNPRAKLEAVPDYLENSEGTLPRDRLLKMINSITNQSIGETDERGGISNELFDHDTEIYFMDDIGVIDKPEELKTKAELRAEKKQQKSGTKKRKWRKERSETTDGAKADSSVERDYIVSEVSIDVDNDSSIGEYHPVEIKLDVTNVSVASSYELAVVSIKEDMSAAEFYTPMEIQLHNDENVSVSYSPNEVVPIYESAEPFPTDLI